jgi:hypothetical protein
MPVTYTNFKKQTYYLCASTTKTGKIRYTFAREQKGEPVEQIPPGYEISESVNGVVSLVKSRPRKILSQELAAVQSVLEQHPQARKYRAGIKQDRIEVYERLGPGANDLMPLIQRMGFPRFDTESQLEDVLDRSARYTAILRFILIDKEQRTFKIQRMCYLGSIDNWMDIGEWGPIDALVPHVISILGTDEFFELL